jgi:hypothetical protein
MQSDDFYRGKSLVRTEWWLDGSRLPATVAWARLRVFDDRASDVCFKEGAKTFGFKNEQYAQCFLGEDEFVSFSNLDSDDEVEYGISLAALVPPTWADGHTDFEYLDVY